MPRTKGELKKTFPVTLPPETKESVTNMRLGKYTDVKIKEICTRHQRAKYKESQDANEKRFLLHGEPADRFEIMAAMVALVSEGMRIIDICKLEGMPTTLEVRHFRKWHSAFDKELKEAELCRGELLGEQALDVALEATDDSNAAVRKLQHEALSKAAARLNSDFTEKKLVQTEDINETQSYEVLMARWKALTAQFPELQTLGDSTGITDAEIITQGEDE